MNDRLQEIRDYLSAHREQMGTIELIRELRQRFGLSLVDAKCVLDTGTLDLEELSEQQESLIDPLQQYLQDEEAAVEGEE